MAKIVEHGKYWSKEFKRVEKKTVLVQCPECENRFLVYYSDCFEHGAEAWCECGCKFIPEECDLIEKNYEE